MYELLKAQFEETKQTLKEVEENIRKLTGRDPDQFSVSSFGNIQLKNDSTFTGKGNAFMAKKRPVPFVPRSNKGEMAESPVPDEESGDEDGVPAKKPSLASTVVATHKDVKSRRATIEQQKSDTRILARNKRMFGMILGTLQKFQNEESRRKEQAQKRAEIEKKVEEASEKEREAVKKERETLFLTRREKQTQIRCLEKKMERAEIHEVWKKSNKLLTNFIQTKAKPQIMYIPAKHNHKSQKALIESQERIHELIRTHSDKAEKELNEIDEWYTKDDMEEGPGDKENIGPDEETEKQIDLGSEQEMCVEETETEIKSEKEIEEKLDVDEKNENEIKDKLPQNETEEENKSQTEDSNINNGNDMEVEKNPALETLADQEFEPIYDE